MARPGSKAETAESTGLSTGRLFPLSGFVASLATSANSADDQVPFCEITSVTSTSTPSVTEPSTWTMPALPAN